MSSWYRYINKISMMNQDKLNKFNKIIHKRKYFFEFTGSFFTQFFIQYIFMFCIPFLYLKEEWFWFLFLVIFSLITLWDPLWDRMIKIKFFRLVLRLIASCMSFSFLFLILFPKNINYFYTILLVICFLNIMPWSNIFHGYKIKTVEIIILLIFLFICSINYFTPYYFKFPVISVWIERGKFAYSKSSENKLLEIITGNNLKRNEFLYNLKLGKQLCVVSPIVAPIGIYSNIYQDWYVDDDFIERIILPKISVSTINEKYKTNSCKSNFKNLNKLNRIVVKTYLKNEIYVGKQTLYISN